MKKLNIIILAVALVMGATQCKKNVETINNAASEGVYITLKVGNGTKHDVDPNSGEVEYNSGDKIYVGHNGAYIGTLTYGTNGFSGTITPGETSDYLYFYFLGGLETTPTTLSAANQSYKVNISSQRESLPVLSLGQSNVPYNSEVTTYTSQLLNQCALVKISLTEETPSYLNVNGMLVEATIDFANHSITPTTTTGTIQLRTQTLTDRWAVMLPRATATNTTATIDLASYPVVVPAISANQHITSGIEIDNDCAISVSANTKVRFSPGNLQYNKTTQQWSFMQFQYNTAEPGATDIGDNYADYNIVSLFGWGTSGWDNTSIDPYSTNYYPYSTDVSSYTDQWTENYYHYGPSWVSGSPVDISGTNYDWGVYNSSIINNGQGYNWRTLTNAEWNYLLYERVTTSGIRFAKATVCGMGGILLPPDNWRSDIYSLNNTNTDGANFDGNIIDLTTWNNMFEPYGVVFLPAAGSRYGTFVSTVGSFGCYWTSTAYDNDSQRARHLYFGESSQYMDYTDRCSGESVRLVRDVH